MGSIGCSETSLRKNHFTLRNIPEERRFHLHHGGSLKSHMNRPVRVANEPVEIRTRHLPNKSRGHGNCIKSFVGPVLLQRVSNKVAQLISCWYLANVFRAPDARLDCGRNTNSSALSEAMRPLTYIRSSGLESPPEHKFFWLRFSFTKIRPRKSGGMIHLRGHNHLLATPFHFINHESP
jgi:hypothetical protein